MTRDTLTLDEINAGITGDPLLRQVVAGAFETGEGKTIRFDAIVVEPWRGMFRGWAEVWRREPDGMHIVWPVAYGRTPAWAARCLGHRIGRVG